MSNNSLLFLGRPDTLSRVGTDGTIIKNRVFYNSVKPHFDRTKIIDLDLIRTPKVLISMLVALLSWRYKTIVVASGGSAPSCRLISLIQLLPSVKFGHSRVYVLGIGGNMSVFLRDNPKGVRVLDHCEAVFVEGKKMKDEMVKMGMHNVYYMPNFKNISIIPEKTNIKKGERMKFLFFSRIIPEKGCDLTFQAVDKLCKSGYGNQFEVGFYGMILDDYRKEFMKSISFHETNSTYHGILDGTNSDTYVELAKYDVFLFPTYFAMEGFPGAVVDAFVAGLPVIASDWKMNSEIIRDGENGFLIPPKDADALAERMQWFIEHPDFIIQKMTNIQKEALLYDTKHILSKSFLEKMGMLR